MNRKDIILKTAIRLFAQNGFSATTTSAIAREAGVAEGLIFHYFQSKEGILISVLEETRERYLSGCLASIENCSTGLEAIKALIDFHSKFSRKNSEALMVMIRDFPSSISQQSKPSYKATSCGLDTTFNLLKKCIKQGQQDGSIRKDIPSGETAFILQGLLIGLSRLRLLEPGLELDSVSRLRSQVVKFCVRAISSIESKN